MKKHIAFIFAICSMMTVSAQQVNNYTHKLDSVCYGAAKEVLSYDNKLNCTEIKTIHTGTVPNIVYAAKSFVYDDENRVLKTDYFREEGMNREIHEYDYNDYGLITEDVLEQYYYDNLIVRYKYTYEYDENNHKTVARGYVYNDGTWEISYRINYEYEDDLLVSSAKYPNDGYGNPREVTKYTYNDQRLCIEEVLLNADQEVKKTIYTYDESGLCTSITVLSKEEDPWMEEWIELSKEAFIYDENGNCKTQEYEDYHSGWSVQYHQCYDWSVPILAVAGFEECWSYLGNFDFIPKNMITSYTIQYVNSGHTSNPIIFHYSLFTGIDEVNGSQVTIMPNPVSETLFIGGEDVSRVDIYTIDGKWMQSSEASESINVGKLSQGCYLLKITLSDGRQTMQKIVKE